MIRSSPVRTLLAAAVFLVAAALQLLVFVREKEQVEGHWFLYGTDTVSHDATVHIWVQQWMDRQPGVIPLWMPGLQGGLPVLGAFLWTPFAPGALPFYALPYPSAQKLSWILTLWCAGMGAYALGRALRMRFSAAVYTGFAWMLSGHIVTLIHAGHFQKVMALGWLPWSLAGVAMLADPHSGCRRATGIATGAAAIGFMFLSGHPQIAYIAGAMVAIHGAWMLCFRPALRARWLRHLAGIAIILGGGAALGGLQLLPGVEMSGLSNRADGVTYAEAIKTSYPLNELPELVIPRFKGSSVRGDIYRGNWGERIVSDYVGKIVVLLVIIGILGGRRFRFQLFWMLAVAVSLTVGVGSRTPLYHLLYDVLPGFKSFRSPGTFMCAAALALTVLSGYGWESLTAGIRTLRRRWVFPLVYTILLLLTIADLMKANRFFLFAESWDRYSLGFLAPNELDLWLIDRGLAMETFDKLTEMRVRPILFDGGALNGYHPIWYKVKDDVDQRGVEDPPGWLVHWGQSHVIVGPTDSARPPFTVARQFPGLGRTVLRFGETRLEQMRRDMGPDTVYTWTVRHPNEQVMVVKGGGGPLRVPEIRAPGHRLYVDGQLMREFPAPVTATEIRLDPGTRTLLWIYEPFSYRLGLFLSAVGAALVLFLIAFGHTHRPPLRLHIVEESAPDPHVGRPLLHSDLKIPRHSHGEGR